jgi:hypothetical protein
VEPAPFFFHFFSRQSTQIVMIDDGSKKSTQFLFKMQIIVCEESAMPDQEATDKTCLKGGKKVTFTTAFDLPSSPSFPTKIFDRNLMTFQHPNFPP